MVNCMGRACYHENLQAVCICAVMMLLSQTEMQLQVSVGLAFLFLQLFACLEGLSYFVADLVTQQGIEYLPISILSNVLKILAYGLQKALFCLVLQDVI